MSIKKVLKRYLATLLAGLLVVIPLLMQPTQAQTARDIAAEKARQMTGGRVLSVSVSEDPNVPGFFVKVLLADGKVRIVHILPE